MESYNQVIKHLIRKVRRMDMSEFGSMPGIAPFVRDEIDRFDWFLGQGIELYAGSEAGEKVKAYVMDNERVRPEVQSFHWFYEESAFPISGS